MSPVIISTHGEMITEDMGHCSFADKRAPDEKGDSEVLQEGWACRRPLSGGKAVLVKFVRP